MLGRLLWNKVVELENSEEHRWLDDAIATIAHAIKTGDRNDFQGWIPESLVHQIKEPPDIRLTSGSCYRVHSLSYGSELLELHEVVFQQYLRAFKPAEEIVITWAEISPTFESDGFGGGCTLISAMGSSRVTIKSLLDDRRRLAGVLKL